MQSDDITITIKANAAQFAAAVAGVVSSTKAMGSTIAKEARAAAEATSRLEESFEGVRNGIKLAMQATGIAVVAGLGIAASSAGDFQSSLSQLRQAAGATSEEMVAMTATAKQLGKDNDLAGITAASAASAMTELAKAGLSVNDTMAASKGVLSLAKAGNMEFAEAAVIAASALNAFGLQGKDATMVADALAAGANASQADLADLALGLQQSATVAKQFKLSINENVTALALFANNGIKGSDAGTSLKTMLIALANPTKASAEAMHAIGFEAYDAQGKFVGLEEMSKRLKESTAKLTDQQKQATLATIFGTDAFRAASVLADNAGESYAGMSKSVGAVGAAQKAAAAQQGAYEKTVEKFNNAMSDVALTVGEKLLPSLTDFISVATEQVEPTFSFLASNGTLIANGLLAIGGAFATIRIAGMVSDLSSAKKSLDLFVGAKNAQGLRAIKDGFVAIGNGAKSGGLAIVDTAKSIAASAVDISSKGAAASNSWIKGAYAASVEWVKSSAKIITSAAAASARAIAHGIAVGVAWVGAATRTTAAWVATAARFVAMQIWMGIEANSPALATGLRWVASAIATAAAWMAAVARVVAGFVTMRIQAIASALSTGVAWVVASVQTQSSWLRTQLSIIGSFVAMARSAIVNSLGVHAAFVSAAVQAKVAWVATKASLVATFVTVKVAALKDAIISGAAWTAAAAKTSIAWLGTSLKMLPFFLGWAIGAAANAAIAASAWVASAAATAAAWIVANAAMLGVWGLIIAAVIGAVALIVANWSTVSSFFAAVFNSIVAAIDTAINWVKSNWPLLIAILSGPIGIAVYWIIRNWELVQSAFINAWENIRRVWGGVVGFFANIWNSIVGIFHNIGGVVASAFIGAVRGAVNGILSFAEGTINNFVRAINGAVGMINKIPGVNIGKLSELHIPRLATGGIVPATPGGRMVTVAEGGQAEWVVPESKMASLVNQVMARASQAPQSSGNGSIILQTGASLIKVVIEGGRGDFSENDAIEIAKKIVRALKGQGLTIDEMGSLR